MTGTQTTLTTHAAALALRGDLRGAWDMAFAAARSLRAQGWGTPDARVTDFSAHEALVDLVGFGAACDLLGDAMEQLDA